MPLQRYGKISAFRCCMVLYKNTLLLIFWRVICACLTATLAGHAFARLEFKGKNFVFSLVLFQMMIPSMGLPKDLEETARLDGCNIFQIFLYVMAPLYSGNFCCEVGDQYGQTRVGMGIASEFFEYELKSEEVFNTPELALCCT